MNKEMPTDALRLDAKTLNYFRGTLHGEYKVCNLSKTFGYVAESNSAAHTGALREAILEPISVCYGKQYGSPYRYLIEKQYSSYRYVMKSSITIYSCTLQ